MPYLRDLLSCLKPTELVYLNICDGNSLGCELAWLPSSERWFGRDHEAGKCFACDAITIIMSRADHDESGMGLHPDLVGVDFSDNYGWWVFKGEIDPEQFDFGENNFECYHIGDPADFTPENAIRGIASDILRRTRQLPPLFDEINDKTGFANGKKFKSSTDVRAYFTPDAQRKIFGAQAITDSALLAKWADNVIAGRWHMSEPEPGE